METSSPSGTNNYILRKFLNTSNDIETKIENELNQTTAKAIDLLKLMFMLEFKNCSDLYVDPLKNNHVLKTLALKWVDKFRYSTMNVSIGRENKTYLTIGENIEPEKARHILIAST